MITLLITVLQINFGTKCPRRSAFWKVKALQISSACWSFVPFDKSKTNNIQTYLHEYYVSFFIEIPAVLRRSGLVPHQSGRLSHDHKTTTPAPLVLFFFSFLWFAVWPIKAFRGLLGLFAFYLMTVISSMKSLTGSAAAAAATTRTEKCCFVRRLLLSQTLLKRQGCRQ